MVTRVGQQEKIVPRVFHLRGFTLVEFIFGLILTGILVAIAAPALHVAVSRNAVDAEAQRLVSDLRLARSEAITRGVPVALCQSLTASCDAADPSTCRCKVGVAAKRYDQGWLVYTTDGGREDFDPDRDILIRIGDAPRNGIEMRSNNAIMHRAAFDRAGGLEGGEPGLIAVCQDGESTDEVPGKMVGLAVTGRIDVGTMGAGEECLTTSRRRR